MISKTNINMFWASLLIEELVRNDITFFCISPGSRSAPLTAAATQHPQTNCQLALDERGAAFMALGYARATGKPAVLICTSGTAAANYYPAVIEASMDDVPMIMLTADRPPELHDTAANQTIHQQKLYGQYTRWDFSLPAPDERLNPNVVLTTIDQAVLRCQSPVAGPVHLNCMFREPLAPAQLDFTITSNKQFERWQQQDKPFTAAPASFPSLEEHELDELAHTINHTNDGLVIFGRLAVPYQQSENIRRFVHKLNWPVYADIASGFRHHTKDWPILDDTYFYAHFLNEWQPETVVFFGGPFLSKRLQQWLDKNPPLSFIHIHNSPRRIDPGHLLTRKLMVDPDILCRQLADKIKLTDRFSAFRITPENVRQNINRLIQSKNINEPAVAQAVSQHIPAGHGLFLGNSMPIRDMNTFAAFDASFVPVAGNRGASGIDGTIATAVGFAHGLAGPVTLFLGDVAALHDLNSLSLLANSPPVIVIIINNDGGGIFSFLPISEHKSLFEKWFETPHGLTFDQAASLFKLPYAQPKSTQDFITSYEKAIEQNSSYILEIRTDKRENHRLHQHIEKTVQQLLDSL